MQLKENCCKMANFLSIPDVQYIVCLIMLLETALLTVNPWTDMLVGRDTIHWLMIDSLMYAQFIDWCMIHWLMLDSLIDDWFIGWLLIHWLMHDSLIDSLVDAWFIDWCVIHWLMIDSLIDAWFIDWWMIHWLMRDLLIDSQSIEKIVRSICWLANQPM